MKVIYIMCAVVTISSQVQFNMASTLTKHVNNIHVNNIHVNMIMHCQHVTLNVLGIPLVSSLKSTLLIKPFPLQSRPKGYTAT